MNPLTSETVFFTPEDPNQDLMDMIYRNEERSEKLLTLTIALMSLNVFTSSLPNIVLSFPFFISSLLFYLLTFMQSPSIASPEMSRKKLFLLINSKSQEGLLLENTSAQQLNGMENSLRALLMNSKNKKSLCMQIANSSLLSFVFIFFTTFLILKTRPDFFNNFTQDFLYLLVFVLLGIVVFAFLFKNKARDFSYTLTWIRNPQPQQAAVSPSPRTPSKSKQ